MGNICNKDKDKNKEISYINIVYDIKQKEINIFGYEFVKNNKNKCKIILGNKEYKLAEICNITDYNNNSKNGKLYIKLKIIGNITNMSYMFYECKLLSLPDFSKLNTSNVTNMSSCFMNVDHYHHYLIFLNGILIKLKI